MAKLSDEEAREIDGRIESGLRADPLIWIRSLLDDRRERIAESEVRPQSEPRAPSL